MLPCARWITDWKWHPEGDLMAHQHLVIAYVITWVIQLGYLGWVGTKWLAVRRDERQTPSYPEK